MHKLAEKHRLTSVFRFAAALLASITFASAAQATPFEFANFRLLNADQPFSFTNNGGTSASIIAVDVPVIFDFTSQSGLSTADHPALLSISNATTTPASSLGSILDQPISNATTLTIIDSGTGMNLLTMVFTGDIIGPSSGPNASLLGAESTGQTVTFSSSFASFTQTANSYNLGLATISPSLSIGPGSFLNSFVANIGGQFTTDSSSVFVPEPSSAVLIAIALLTLGAGACRKTIRAAFA